MGRAALEGLRGVQKVESGFRDLKEINRVHYDPGIISLEAMESALKRANTFLGRAP